MSINPNASAHAPTTSPANAWAEHPTAPTPSDKMLFHIHAREFGAGSPLEGHTTAETLAYLNQYITGLTPENKSYFGLTDDLVEQLNKAGNLAKKMEDAPAFIQELQKELGLSFDSQKFLLIPGGWIGSPFGHALYYEVIPESDSTATFRIYNAGGGVTDHAQMVLEGVKTKVIPYVDWKGVQKDRLMNPGFIKAIQELKTNRETTKGHGREYTDKDVYLTLKELLQPVEVIVGDPVKGPVITAQDPTGICSWKSLTAFLHSRMDETGYKRFMVAVKLNSLDSFVKSKEGFYGNLTQSSYHLSIKSYTKLCRRVVELYNRSMVGDAEFQGIKERMETLKSNFEKIRTDRLQSRDPSDRSIKKSISTPTDTVPLSQKTIHAEGAPYAKTVAKVQKFAAMDLWSAADLKEMAQIFSEAEKAGEHIGIQVGLFELFHSIDLETKLNHDPAMAEEMIAHLGTLAKHLFKSSFHVPNPMVLQPSRQFIMYKLMAAICSVANTKSHINENGNPFKPIEGLLRLDLPLIAKKKLPPYLTFFDTTLIPETKELQAHDPEFLEKKPAVTLNISIPYNPKKDLYFLTEFKHDSNRDSFRDLAGYIRRTNPRFVEEVSAKNREFSSYSDYEQDGYLVFQSALPPWLLAIRDTIIYSEYLQKSPLIQPEVVQPNDLTLNIVFGKDYDGINVKIKLNGITPTLFNNSAELKELYGSPPEQERMKKNRYKELQRPFVNEDLDKFIQWVDRHSGNAPKWFLAINEAVLKKELSLEKCSLSIEECREFLKLMDIPQLKIAELMEYYTRHSEKLRDPDFQTVFKLFFFDPKAIEWSMKQKGFPLTIEKFLKENYERLVELNDIQSAVFILQVCRYLRDSYPEDSSFVRKNSDHLHALLERTGLSPDEKSLINGELIAHLRKQKEPSAEQIDEMIKAIVFRAANPPPFKWREPETEQTIIETMSLHSKAIIERLLLEGIPNQILLNEIVHHMMSNEESLGWKVIATPDKFPVFTSHSLSNSLDERYQFYPSTGLLISRTVPMPIPGAITRHPHFQELYPDVKEAMLMTADFIRFKDKGGEEVYVKFDAKTNGLTIEKRIENEWHRFVPKSEFDAEGFEPYFISRYLVSKYSHWQSLSNTKQVLLLDEAGIVRYKAGDDVYRISDQCKLVGYLPAEIEALDDPAFTHVWTQQRKFKQLEYPRLGISFNEKYECEQFPGYFYKKKSGNPLGRSFSSFCLLYNPEKKKTLLLLPRYNFENDPNSSYDVLETRYFLDKKKNNADPIPFYSFEVEDDLFISKNKEANLYLAEVLAVNQEYEKAAYYLQKHGRKVSVYTPKELKCLKEISTINKVTNDLSGEGYSLRVFALYLYIKNSTVYNHPLTKTDYKQLSSQYLGYLEHYRQNTTIRLNKQQEIFVLKTLLQRSYLPQFYYRLRELDPEAAKGITAINVMPFEQEKSLLLSSDNLREPQKSYFFPGIDKLIITRPDEIMQNFIPYYKLAISGTDAEKQKINSSLPFLANFNKQPGYARLLEKVLDYPGKFQENMKWNQIVEVAASLPEREKTVTARGPYPLQDVTADDFHLDPIEHAIHAPEVTWSWPDASRIEVHEDAFEQVVSSPTIDDTVLVVELEKIVSLTDDTLELRDVQRLREDVEVFHEIAAAKPVYQLKELNKIKETLEKSGESEVEKHKRNLLKFANVLPADPLKKMERELLIEGKSFKKNNLQEMIVSFARGKTAEKMRQRNPNLHIARIQYADRDLKRYLLCAVKEQQRVRALGFLQKVEKGDEEAVQDLANEVLAEPAYDYKERPQFLVLEYYANIRLRKDQVEKIEEFLKDGNYNLIAEIIMGFGKSKVLMPLLMVLFADANQLATMVVPQALIDSLASAVGPLLSEGFGQELSAFHFDRSTPVTKENLETILDDINATKRYHQCLVMTNKSICCLILKFIEEKNRCGKENSSEFLLMKDILNALRKNAKPIFDEVDTLLNVLHEFSYSLGSSGSPEKYEISLIKHFYSLLYTDKELRNAAALESDPHPQEGAMPLTEELYHEKIRDMLAEKILDDLAAGIVFEDDKSNSQIKDFLKEGERQLALWYLTHDGIHANEAQEWYDKQAPFIQNVMGLAGEEISHLFPFTLTSVHEVKYGVDTESSSINACPYSYAKTPNKNSLFVNRHITENFSFQSYAKKGVDADLLKRFIEQLQNKALQELRLGAHGVEQTLAWKEFLKLREKTSIHLFNYSEVDFNRLLTDLNEDRNKGLRFVENFVIPDLKLSQKKISCNPHILASFYLTFMGFTGHLWNGLSMHRKTMLQPAAGTDAQTLSLLFKRCDEEALVVEEGSVDGLLAQMLPTGCDLIIDAGGYYKQGSNEEVAMKMSAQTHKPCVYFDGDEFIADADAKSTNSLIQSTLDPAERVTFIDQSHTTGADIKQKPTALGLVTISRNMLLRDLLQSCWRERELHKKQTVKFVVSKEVAQIIRQTLHLSEDHKITLREILRFCIRNQVKRQGLDNFKGLKEELASLQQMVLLEALLTDQLTDDEANQIFDRLIDLWIKEASLSPKDMYGRLIVEEDSPKVLARLKEQSIQEIKALFIELPFLSKMSMSADDYVKEVHIIAERIANAVPPKVRASEQNLDRTMEMESEKESEKENETETELESQSQAQEATIKLGYEESDKRFLTSLADFQNTQSQLSPNLPYFTVKDVMENLPALADYADAFEDIHLSLNALEWKEVDKVELLGQYRTAFTTLFVNGDDVCIDLLSKIEFAHDDPELNKRIEVKDSFFKSFSSDEVVPKDIDSELRREIFTSVRYFMSINSDVFNEKEINLKSVFELFTKSKLDPGAIEYYQKNPEQFNKIISAYFKFREEYYFHHHNLYFLASGFIDSERTASEALLRKIVKVKFLNGDSFYSQQEKTYLKEWLRQSGIERMKELHRKHILAGYPDKAKAFQGSTLEAVFKELI